MKSRLLMLTIAMSCAFAGNVLALTKAEYSTQKDQIKAEYKASRDKCSSMKANAKDICVAEAKGTEKIAKAELESQYKPNAKNTRDVAMANTLVQAHANALIANPIQPANAMNADNTGNTGNTVTIAAKTVVLLAGSGHVDRTLGVPQHLPPNFKIKSVLLVAGNASDAADRTADFDVVWSAAPVPPQDYCAGLKGKMAG